MEEPEINPLIAERVDKDVEDPAVRGFIADMLKIERTHLAKRGKQQEYEKAMSRRLKRG